MPLGWLRKIARERRPPANRFTVAKPRLGRSESEPRARLGTLRKSRVAKLGAPSVQGAGKLGRAGRLRRAELAGAGQLAAAKLRGSGPVTLQPGGGQPRCAAPPAEVSDDAAATLVDLAPRGAQQPAFGSAQPRGSSPAIAASPQGIPRQPGGSGASVAAGPRAQPRASSAPSADPRSGSAQPRASSAPSADPRSSSAQPRASSAPSADPRSGSAQPGRTSAAQPVRSVAPRRAPTEGASLLARAASARVLTRARWVALLGLARRAWPRALIARTWANVRQRLGLARAGAAASTPLVAGQAPTPELPERGIDLVLLLAVLGLLCLGSTIIYSSTAAGMPRSGGSFLTRQLVYVSMGGVAMWLAAGLDYRRLRRMTYPLLVAAMVLLFAALLFGARNGAHRWIGVGSLTFQPVELAKLALITYVAQSLARKADRVKTFTIGFVPHLVVCGAMMMLLLKQPDLGSSVVLGATTLAMLFVAGARISYIVLAVLAAAPIAYHLVVGTPWRLQRVLAYFNPEAYAQGEAYQFLQARLAIGSGGFAGVGLGRGNQSLGYLPEAHNDFVAAPLGEELGFVGVALVLILFGVLLWRGLRAALGARDAFGSYLAFGITFLLGSQALFNLGVVFGVIPNKGITLPLVSYGGTSLIVTMFLVGLLLNVGRRRHFRSSARALVNAPRKKRQRVRVALA